ncbi:MAG: hypothetical protein SGJ09_08420 [Phycisphaerae bacterium]|nr:hypothetical protein [Phycisphaerae bacterium]
MVRLPHALAISFCIVTIGGCESTPKSGDGIAPVVVTIDRMNYAKAFDAAVALASDRGMPADLRDRDAGVIETRAKVAGSVIEPWDWPRGETIASIEGTISYQRRRARFEFTPSGFRPTLQAEDAPLFGQRTPGTVTSDASGAVDLTTYDGPIDLRVWVYVEQAFTPGLQRSTWTFSQTSFSTNPLKNEPMGDGTTRDRSIWTPVERDEVMERMFLEEIQSRLTSSVAKVS